jgi:carbonic anhydrase
MKVLRLSVVIAAMLTAAPFVSAQQGSEHQEWSYEGPTGPLNWGKLPGNGVRDGPQPVARQHRGRT